MSIQVILHPSAHILHTCTMGIPNQCCIIQPYSSDRHFLLSTLTDLPSLLLDHHKCLAKCFAPYKCMSRFPQLGRSHPRYTTPRRFSALRSQVAYESPPTKVSPWLALAAPVASLCPSALTRACSPWFILRERVRAAGRCQRQPRLPGSNNCCPLPSRNLIPGNGRYPV